MATPNLERDLQKSILEFNNNPENQKLIDYYTSKSFFEILSKPRSETVHSSFLAWILEGKDFSTGILDSPVMGLLDIISEKNLESAIQNADPYEFPKDLLPRVLSRSATVTIDSVKLEEGLPDIDDKEKNKKENRFDIILRCTVNNYDVKNRPNNKLLIVIENKIGSKESSKTNEQNKKIWQTERYFNSIITSESGQKTYQEYYKIFVFLTSPDANGPQCSNFVHITYQDIMDRILDPLSNSSKLSGKAKVIIQDYIKTLSVPAFTENDEEKKTAKYSVLAVGTEEQKKLIDFATTNENLIRQLQSLYSNQKETKKTDEDSIASNFREKYKQLFMAATAILNTCSDVDNNIISNLNTLYGSESESSIYDVKINKINRKLGRMATARWIITELWNWKNNVEACPYAQNNPTHKQYIDEIKAIINKHDRDDKTQKGGLITVNTNVICTGNDDFNENTYKEIFKASNIYIYNQWRPENFNENFEFKDGDFEITVKLSNGQKEEANENK